MKEKIVRFLDGYVDRFFIPYMLKVALWGFGLSFAVHVIWPYDLVFSLVILVNAVFFGFPMFVAIIFRIVSTALGGGIQETSQQYKKRLKSTFNFIELGKGVLWIIFVWVVTYIVAVVLDIVFGVSFENPTRLFSLFIVIVFSQVIFGLIFSKIFKREKASES